MGPVQMRSLHFCVEQQIVSYSRKMWSSLRSPRSPFGSMQQPTNMMGARPETFAGFIRRSRTYFCGNTRQYRLFTCSFKAGWSAALSLTKPRNSGSALRSRGSYTSVADAYWLIRGGKTGINVAVAHSSQMKVRALLDSYLVLFVLLWRCRVITDSWSGCKGYPSMNTYLWCVGFLSRALSGRNTFRPLKIGMCCKQHPSLKSKRPTSPRRHEFWYHQYRSRSWYSCTMPRLRHSRI